jgi:hypothetical protein
MARVSRISELGDGHERLTHLPNGPRPNIATALARRRRSSNGLPHSWKHEERNMSRLGAPERGSVLASRTVAQARRARGLGANTRSGDLGACASGEAISTPTWEGIVLKLIEVIAHIAARFYSSERFWDDDLDVHDPLAS